MVAGSRRRTRSRGEPAGGMAAPSAEPQEEGTNEEERESSKKVRPLTPKSNDTRFFLLG